MSSSRVQAAMRFVRTVRHLDPEQVAQRALRAVRRPRGPAAGPQHLAERAGWAPRAARCRRAVEPGVLAGEFEFWGVRRRLALDRAWDAADLGLSWNYPVHYHDALPALADSADTHRRAAVRAFVDAWIAAHPPGTPCAWDPYPTALRIVNWLDVLSTWGEDTDAAWRQRVLRSIWLQAAWVEARLERHLLGTHLLKDAKALAVAGRVFEGRDAERWRRRGDAIVRRELARQVHADGGHLEPSVAYHAVALEDVLDLLAFEPEGGGLRTVLAATAERMLGFLQTVQTPAGGIPLLGDCGAEAGPRPGALFEYAARLGIASPMSPPDVVVSPGGEVRWLSSSRLCVYRDARQYVLIDAGGVGPPHLAAHGHCDSLSFEWWVDGMPIVVDTGTTSYESGPLRDACRATRAHNTIEIDGHEQHEIWAAFRVARRSRVNACLESGSLVATLRPWHAPRARVERRFDFAADGVRVRDRVLGARRVASRLHFHPDSRLRLETDAVRIEHAQARARIAFDAAFTLLGSEQSRSVHCERLGVARANAVIAIEANTPADGAAWESEITLRPA